MEIAGPITEVTLEDKYRLERGVALMSGLQALVRLPVLQRRRDAAAGLKTAGFISGYRGSPIGGYDRELWRAKRLLDENGIVFQPGLNEDLAATAVWGTQQIGLFPGRYDGVFALWYGKGPGVERSGDALMHGHYAGAARSGGVLVVAADDPAAKSSTIAQQSESTLAAHHMPVLYPASVAEILEFGLLGWALSRYSGLWVGLKCVNETLETDVTVSLDEEAPRIILPEYSDPPREGVNFRGTYGPIEDERLLVRHRLPLAGRFALSNRLDRSAFSTAAPQLGIVSAGKTYSDVLYALRLLGIDDERARLLRLDIYKVGMIWPLETSGLRAFASRSEELLVIEEKQPLLEAQIASALYGADHQPRLSGKEAAEGGSLLPSDGTLAPGAIALAIAARLERCGMADADLRLRAVDLRQRFQALAPTSGRPTAKDMQSGTVRTPYFCSGCPHNTSTRVPEGSRAFSGIGCHTMVVTMGRSTLPPTHMGGEGANWIGIAPFVDTPHIFQNLGDGTYFHSGLIAIRAAVAANVNITYKVLYNGVVAMTGGQPIDGNLSVQDIARQVIAERVARCVVVTVEPAAYDGDNSLPPGVTLHARDELDAVQRQLRDVRGVTVLIYEQMCAAEKRRQIKRKTLPAPTRRVFINESVCEGCGDCSTKSNCVSVLPKETPFGRKRTIDQSACNEDLSCIKGFCPSFVLIRNARPRRGTPAPQPPTAPATMPLPLPPPPVLKIQGGYNVMITGIGGTGVITVGAVLAMAAHLEGRGASTYNMTGLAQKNGPVYSHLRFATSPEGDMAFRIEAADADLVVACDVLAGLAPEAFETIRKGHTRALINSDVEPTAAFQLFRDSPLPGAPQCDLLMQAVGPDRIDAIDATGISLSMLGDKIAGNVLMVGYALQRGLLPLRPESIERAIELNDVSVDLNKAALRLGRQLALAGPGQMPHAPEHPEPVSLDPLEAEIALARALLTSYQNGAYAERYVARVRAVAATEAGRVPTSGTGLALAVARNYRKLLAYKDEYEVARLYTVPAFQAAVGEAFEGAPRISVLLAPPFMGGGPGPDGNPRKREFGPWIFAVFRLLARCKGLRGSMLDPFGYTRERRRERELIREYEGWIDTITEALTPANHASAMNLASLPELIRGFGNVKLRSITAAQKAAVNLLATIRNQDSPECN